MTYSSSYGDIPRTLRSLDIQDGYAEDPHGSGLRYATFDFKTNQAAPKVHSGKMWTDEDFPPWKAITGCTPDTIEWNRPHEFLKDPQLFAHGADRYDVEQGGFGTCWFIAMLSNLADKPRLLKKVINTDSYTPRTDGICHCKLWKFGRWVDIYIDDYLPLRRGRTGLEFYGAQSGTASNELWVSLVEKTLAKMYGSYSVVNEGGWPSEAYLALTGGVAESVWLPSYTSRQKDLFRRLDKALETGAVVTSCILAEDSGEKGLVGPHAYALNKTAKVEKDNGEAVRLIRLMNPWGTGEWKGKWSDESLEWETLVKGRDLKLQRDDGEFWMSLSDFMASFHQLTICSLTPDVDKDGRADPLNYVLTIFGEWGTTVKLDIPNICKKSLYFNTYRDLAPDGTIPVVVQVIQDEFRHDNYCNIGCDVFSGDGLTRIPDIEGRPPRAKQLQHVLRYNLSTGTYTLLPSRDKVGQNNEVVLRLFSPCPIYASKSS